MIQKRFTVFLIFLFLFIVSYISYCSAGSFVSEWAPLTRNKKGFFYNKERISHPDRHIVSIWTWEKNTMKLYAIRCPTKQHRVLHIIHYDSKGNVSQSLPVRTKRWDLIPPGSITERAYEIACFKRDGQ
jgi:hypothetical protein